MPVTRRPYRTFGMREGHPAPPLMPYKAPNPGAQTLQAKRAAAKDRQKIAGAIARLGGTKALSSADQPTAFRALNPHIRSDIGQANPSSSYRIPPAEQAVPSRTRPPDSRRTGTPALRFRPR